MKAVLKYWKLYIALILMFMAVYLHVTKFQVERLAYEAQSAQMELLEDALEKSVEKNLRYKDIQVDLEAAKAELDASRLELYQHFPKELKEEDQIMYVLYLETLFGTEINFSFSQPVSLVLLSDMTDMQGMLIDVNYETTYEGFKDMLRYLSSDDKVVSVYNATIEYDANKDVASGTLTLILYMMDTSKLEYTAPDVAIPEYGKDNIFE